VGFGFGAEVASLPRGRSVKKSLDNRRSFRKRHVSQGISVPCERLVVTVTTPVGFQGLPDSAPPKLADQWEPSLSHWSVPMQRFHSREKNEMMVSEMSAWVHDLAPWQVISHLTFAFRDKFDRGVSIAAAQRAFEKFMRRQLSDVSYFYAIERNGQAAGVGHHVHALFADCTGMLRTFVWEKWFNRYGRAKIEPVRSQEDVTGYCAKYVCKEGAWWNVKLQSPELWHRATGVIAAR